MIQEEIEWILWIHVDEDQIRIVHEQLAEAETVVPVGPCNFRPRIFSQGLASDPPNDPELE